MGGVVKDCSEDDVVPDTAMVDVEDVSWYV